MGQGREGLRLESGLTPGGLSARLRCKCTQDAGAHQLADPGLLDPPSSHMIQLAVVGCVRRQCTGTGATECHGFNNCKP